MNISHVHIHTIQYDIVRRGKEEKVSQSEYNREFKMSLKKASITSITIQTIFYFFYTHKLQMHQLCAPVASRIFSSILDLINKKNGQLYTIEQEM